METLTKKSSKNGTATKAVKNGATKNGSTAAAKPAPKSEVKPAEKTPVKFSLDERIQRVEELRGLTTKRQRALNTLNELRTFHYAGTDSVHLEMTDSADKVFKTTNSNLVGLLSDYLQKLLGGKIKELDGKILGFEI